MEFQFESVDRPVYKMDVGEVITARIDKMHDAIPGKFGDSPAVDLTLIEVEEGTPFLTAKVRVFCSTVLNRKVRLVPVGNVVQIGYTGIIKDTDNIKGYDVFDGGPCPDLVEADVSDEPF